MNLTSAFTGPSKGGARVPQRRYGHKFSGPKFKPAYRSTRRRRFPKPKGFK